MPNTYYVDNALFAGHAEGTARDAYSTTIQLAAEASSENDAYNNYGIWIVSGTGAGQSRRITDYNGTTQFAIVSAWTITPDDTSVYEITVGADDNSGANEGTGSTGAFRTWQKALDTVAAGDTVNIKAGRAYAEAADLKTAGTLAANVQLRGYKTTPHDWLSHLLANPTLLPNDPVWDQYRAKLSGLSLTTSIVATQIYYVLESLWIDGVAAAPAFTLVKDKITALNCRGSNSLLGFGCASATSGGRGFYCVADNNSVIGFASSWDLQACQSLNNGADGVSTYTRGSVQNCIIAGNTGKCIDATAGLSRPVAGNTLVGNTGAAGEIGLNVNESTGAVTILNNLFVGLSQGIVGVAAVDQACHVVACNGFFDVDTPRVDFPEGFGDIEGADPGFVDPDNGDYRLRYDSPARGKGWPAYLDIGALQRREVATHRPINLGVQV